MYLAVCTFAVKSFHVLHKLPWAAFLAQCCCRPISLRRQRSLGLFFTCSYARSGCLVTSRLCLSSVARDCIPRATSTAKRRTSHCTALPACRRRTPCSETRVVANDACFMILYSCLHVVAHQRRPCSFRRLCMNPRRPQTSDTLG